MGFTAEKIHPNITRIHTEYAVDMFLVEGDSRAMLIDTGFGIGQLKSYVERLTDLPYQVVLTHGHVDHAGGSQEFDQVYLNRRDWELERDHTAIDFRQDFAAMLSGNTPKREDMIPQRQQPYLDLEDGQIFDLGGLTLEMIACPGHTPGCMCILIRELRLLILGDACNSKSFFFFPEALPIKEYYQNLQRLCAREEEFDHVLFFHADNWGDKNNIKENLEVCREILDNRDDRVAKDLLGYHIFVAKATAPDDHRLDGKDANIFYSAEKIG